MVTAQISKTDFKVKNCW